MMVVFLGLSSLFHLMFALIFRPVPPRDSILPPAPAANLSRVIPEREMGLIRGRPKTEDDRILVSHLEQNDPALIFRWKRDRKVAGPPPAYVAGYDFEEAELLPLPPVEMRDAVGLETPDVRLEGRFVSPPLKKELLKELHREAPRSSPKTSTQVEFALPGQTDREIAVIGRPRLEKLGELWGQIDPEQAARLQPAQVLIATGWDGQVTHAFLEETSGSAEADKAVMRWLREFRFGVTDRREELSEKTKVLASELIMARVHWGSELFEDFAQLD